MGISVSSPNIPKFKRYSLGKFQTDIQVSNVENLEDFFDYNSVYNISEEKIYEVGAHTSSISKSIFSDENQGFISNNFTSAVNEIVSTAGSLASTGVVISSSVVSGGAKLVEHLSDGLTWTAGKIVDGFFNVAAFGAGLFSKDAKESVLEAKKDFDSSVREHIARDQVEEFNQVFYENTKLGRIINKNSYIKYDSDVAKTIQNVTTTTVEIGLATAATVLTGGMAAPISAAAVASIGFIDAAGASAEKHYSTPEVSDNAEVDILLDGVVGSLEWYSFGKLGANAVGAVHAINQAGVEGVKTTIKATTMAIKEEFANKGVAGIAKTGVQNVVNKKNFLTALKLSLSDVDTYTDVSGVIASDLKRYYNGEDIDILDVGAKLGGVIITNVGLTAVSHGLLTKSEADEFIRLNNESLSNALKETSYVQSDLSGNDSDFISVSKQIDSLKDSVAKNLDVDVDTNESFADIFDKYSEKLSTDIREVMNSKINFSNIAVSFVSSPLSVMSRMIYTPVKNNSDICDTMIKKGIYHLTKLENAQKILDSGYVKASGYVTSYGSKKSFFFAGEPTLEDVALNCPGILEKAVAVKFDIDSTDLSGFRYRSIGDKAVTMNGNYVFDLSKAKLVYLGLFNENGNLTYKEISEDLYSNFHTDISSGLLNQKVAGFKSKLVGLSYEGKNMARNINNLVTIVRNANVKETMTNIVTTFHTVFHN